MQRIYDIAENNDEINKYLLVTDIENRFPIFMDKDNNYIFNLNETVNFEIDKSMLKEYICPINMNWQLASYKIYGTTRLYWLLLKINNIDAEKIFEPLKNGDKIYYIDGSYIEDIAVQINEKIEEEGDEF